MIITHQNFSAWKAANKSAVLESNTMLSVTVPDRTLTLRQLIERHNSGGAVKSFVPSYLGDTNLIPVGFERMSLVERAEILKNLPHFISDARGKLITLREAAEKARKQAEADARMKEAPPLKEQPTSSPS